MDLFRIQGRPVVQTSPNEDDLIRQTRNVQATSDDNDSENDENDENDSMSNLIYLICLFNF